MKSWKRIILVTFVLIGGTAFGGYWSFHEFNSALDKLSNLGTNLGASQAATYVSVAPQIITSEPPGSTGTSTVSTSTDALALLEATSTVLSTASSTASSTVSSATSSTESSISTFGSVSTTTSSDQFIAKPFNKKEFYFVFPSGKNSVYIGCTYDVSWSASTTIQTIGTSLIDAGTLKSSGPIASGLSRENTIEPDTQNIKWEVGKVWPGQYYIYVSTANGTSTNIKSQAFTISEFPNGLGISEQQSLCETSGGLF